MEILVIIGVVMFAAAQIFLTLANRALLDFWQNLPADVHALDFQIERQVALLERKLGKLECELQPPSDSPRSGWEQTRVNDRVEAAIARPSKVIRRLQQQRATRIQELKELYLAGRDLSDDT